MWPDRGGDTSNVLGGGPSHRSTRVLTGIDGLSNEQWSFPLWKSRKIFALLAPGIVRANSEGDITATSAQVDG